MTFDELLDVVRHKLHRGPSAVSDLALKALWCKLDVDSSNELEGREMAHFLKLGAASKPTSTPLPNPRASKAAS